MLTRFHDWPERLAEFLDSRSDMPFEWQANDCGTFSCAAVEVMTGIDLRVEVTRHYSDVESARAAMGGSLADFAAKVAERYGIPEIPVKMARRGDLALHISREPVGITLGVVSMSGTEILGPSDAGLASYPLLECSRAWRI